MTNEALAALIGAGGNDELIPVLWEKVRKFYRMQADKYAARYPEQCARYGVTAADLQQEGYLSMLEAVKAYAGKDTDAAFITFCGLQYKNKCASLIGIRRGHTSDALNRCYISLNEPLENKDGDTDATRGELIPDPEAEKPFQLIEREDYRQWIRQTMQRVLEPYENPRLWEVIKGYYFEGRTLQSFADEWGITKERVRGIRQSAERKLQRSAELRKQYMLSEYHHIGIEAFTRGGSIVERVAEERDRTNAYAETIRDILGDGDTEQDKAKREILREILEQRAARENLQAPAPEKATA